MESSPHELPRQVEERLLVVVVALRRDLVVLQVLLPVEGDLLGLDLAILDIHLVSAEYDRDVFTHPADRKSSCLANCPLLLCLWPSSNNM